MPLHFVLTLGNNPVSSSTKEVVVKQYPMLFQGWEKLGGGGGKGASMQFV